MSTQGNKYLTPSENFIAGKDYSPQDDDDDDIVEEVEEIPICRSYRLWVIICCTLSMTITYAAQASLSSAMVCMTEDSDYHHDRPNPGNTTVNNTVNTTINFFTLINSTGTHHKEWLFDWDKTKQGLAISSFFMGYYVSQIPSSILAARFGPKRVIVVSLVLVSIFQCLAVPAAHFGIGWLYADRVIAGIIDGFLYAPTFALAGYWAPRHETSLLFGIVGMGMELGNVLSYATSLLACEIVVQEGWPFVFYIIAVLGIIVAIIIMIIVSDSPFHNRHMSKKEVKYLASFIPKRRTTQDEQLSRVPVKEILSSLSVWAIVVSQIGSDWLYYFFVTMEPTFLKDVIKLSNAKVNLLSGLPFLGIIPTIYLAGYLCDKLVTKGVISNTKVRKINDFICKIIPSGILIGLGFLPQDSTAGAFVLNLLGIMCMGFSYVSWMANPVDLAPAYTGFIVGICEIGAIWVGIVVPIVFDDITVDKTREEWQLVFYITAGIQAFCFLFYAIFASGELQPWAVTTLKHAYEDLDDHVDGDQDLLGDAMTSKSHSKMSYRNNQSKDDEDERLLTSLSLSLGDFRGTSSYEASMRRNQERRKFEAGEISKTIIITGPAHRSIPLGAGQLPESGRGQQSYYQGAGMDGVIVRGGGKSGNYIPDGALIVPKPVPFVIDIKSLGFENEHYIESDDESWQNTATRSLPSNLTRSVVHGHGDHDINTAVSSPWTSGHFDDEVSAGPPRNIKSLAVEIAEALSVHSLNEPIENKRNAKLATSGMQRSDKEAATVKVREVGKKNVNGENNKIQNIKKKDSELDTNLDIATSRNIKYLKLRRDNSRNKGVPKQDSTLYPGTKYSQLNSGNTSSIMVPSDDLSVSVDTASLDGKNGDLKKRNHTEKGQQSNSHKDSKQLTGIVRRLLLLGRSKSNPHFKIPEEEPFVFVTEEDVMEKPSTDVWATKSFDGARSTKITSKRSPYVNMEKEEVTKNVSTADDEHTLFVRPHEKFKSSKK